MNYEDEDETVQKCCRCGSLAPPVLIHDYGDYRKEQCPDCQMEWNNWRCNADELEVEVEEDEGDL